MELASDLWPCFKYIIPQVDNGAITMFAYEELLERKREAMTGIFSDGGVAKVQTQVGAV